MVVKFYHSGLVDKKSRTKEERYQNAHKGKLISNSIMYVDKQNQVCETDNGYFWGEWEAESVCNKQDGFYVHKIKYPSKVTFNKNPASCGCCGAGNKKPLNTDPYVFGEYFIYSNCKQGRYKKLKELNENDLIIFGSHKNNAFILDTVFVVDKKIDLNDCSKCFMSATGDLIIDGDFTVYKGKTFNDGKNMFSFFPCSTKPFKRPEVEIKGTNDVQKQGVAYVSKANSKKVWEHTKSQVINQDCMLGIYAKEPKENGK